MQTAGICIHAFEDPESLLEEYEAARAGCLVVDHDAIGTEGIIFLQERLQSEYCAPFILFGRRPGVTQIRRALHHGAVDFLERPVTAGDLLPQLRQTLSEHKSRRQAFLRERHIQQCFESLSKREREVLNLVLAGQLSKQIAAKLSISIKTVEAHRANIVRKMHATSFLQVAIMVATRRDVTADDRASHVLLDV